MQPDKVGTTMILSLTARISFKVTPNDRNDTHTVIFKEEEIVHTISSKKPEEKISRKKQSTSTAAVPTQSCNVPGGFDLILRRRSNPPFLQHHQRITPPISNGLRSSFAAAASEVRYKDEREKEEREDGDDGEGHDLAMHPVLLVVNLILLGGQWIVRSHGW